MNRLTKSYKRLKTCPFVENTSIDNKIENDNSKKKETELECLDDQKKNFQVKNEDEEKNQIFSVLIGPYKPTKKHQEWDDDAILVRKDRLLILYNLEGEKIENEHCYKKDKLIKTDDRLNLNSKIILVCDPISQSDFLNGKCFEKNYCPVITEKKIENKVTNSPFLKNFLSKKNSKPNIDYKNFFVEEPQKKVEDFQKKDEEESNDNLVELLIFPSIPKEYENFQKQKDVIVNYDLTKVLRPHQREGIIFMYRCIAGIDNNNLTGCILADEMGLGKTLQCVVLTFTLLKDGPFNKPFLNNVLILTPSSLVNNWAKEYEKWLSKYRIFIYAVDNKKNTVKNYLKQKKTLFPILIISYEKFLKNAKELSDVNFDLLICDEGHRLKNSKIKVCEAINEHIKTNKKIILTGTPIQNNLQELYTLVNIVNPGILGSFHEYKKFFEEPILNADLKEADDQTKMKGQLMMEKLIDIVCPFILRRTQEELENYLPKKIEYVVVCSLSELQKKIYEKIVEDKKLKKVLDENLSPKNYLPYISFLRKLSNHPFLVYKPFVEKIYQINDSCLIKELEPLINNLYDLYSKSLSGKSGKFDALIKLLSLLHINQQKIVIVSHFTQTLDLVQQFLRSKNFSFLRLDGKTPISNRQKLVDQFNDENSSVFAFLLSSKAGGCGLNLIGASNIVLYDIDWNPANDLQAMSRIWRDGQKKTVNIYRFLSAGTIEEKIYQRQIKKQKLNTSIKDQTDENIRFSKEDLKDVFSIDKNTLSSTHDAIGCDCIKKTNQQQENFEFELQENDLIESLSENEEISNDSETNDNYFNNDLYDQENKLVNKIDYEEEEEDCLNFKLDEDKFEDEKIFGLENTKKSLLQWEHFPHPIENSDLNSILLEAKDNISFVFRNVTNCKT